MSGEPRGIPLPRAGFESEALRIRAWTGGPFQENTYLVECRATGETALVDPGWATPAALQATPDGVPDAVLLTHAHLDHVEGLPFVVEAGTPPIHLHPADRDLYSRAREQGAAFGYEFGASLPEPDHELVPGEPVSVGRVRLDVRFAPGHAPGHVIFHAAEEGVALVGDVIFQRSIGRTDLPGGDASQLLESIRREVLTLDPETRLLTGHGPSTTVKEEKMGNPFLRPSFRPDSSRLA
ncbi:MAG: MBL fold metallo-hydrolase [Gemmatimonadales bacterium]|nr:MAG: MBL fold metallo-hydrolase [Gemmatimonadales bacterium]